MATATQSTMAKTDFVKSAPYLALTECQRKWVDIFIETSDANLATRNAYGAKDDAYVAMFTRKTETSLRIIAALDLYFARSPREKFLRDLQNDIAHSKGVAKIEARRLYAKMVFGVDGPPTEEAEHRFKVGDICVQSGQKFRVTSIDANGQPLTADEVNL